MKRYEVTGKPNIPFDILIDHSIGDVVEAELDKDEEKLLVDMGAVKVLPAERKHAKQSKPHVADDDAESKKPTPTTVKEQR